MTDLATLGFRVDSRDVKRAETDLRRMGDAGKVADKGARQAEAGTARLAATARRATAIVAGITAAIGATGAVMRAAQEYTNISNGFRAMGQSAEEAARTIGLIGDIAERTRAPLTATAELYRRISVAGKDLGASQQDVLRFTENVGLALAASGTSANEASGALLQLSQAMAGGVVRAEEFNSILEGAYPIAQAAANGIDAAGGSVGRLRQLVVDGKISSDEFFNAILSQTDQLQEAFANTTPTISQAMTVLRDQFTLFSGAMDQTIGVSAAVARAILFVAENIERLATYAATAAAIIGGRLAASIALAAARTATLSGALLALKGALIRTGIGALVIGAGELVYQFARLVQSTGGFGNALSLLGDVAAGVWEGITISAQAIPPALQSVWEMVRAGFYSMLEDITLVWSRFLGNLGADLSGTGIPGLVAMGEAISKMSGEAVSALSEYNAKAEAASAASKRLREEAAGLASQGFEKAREAASKLADAVNSTSGETDGASEAADRLNKGLKDLGSPGGGAGKAKRALEKVKDEAEAFNDTLKEAARTAEEVGKEKANILIGGIDGIADAWGDFVSRGFTDFKSFAKNILGSFQQMISRMVAMAGRERIMFNMGITPGGVAGAAGVAGGGGGGGLLNGIFGITSKIGGFFGNVWSGLSGVFSGGVGLLGGIAKSFGALGSLFTGATSALGGFAGALGAALPALGLIGLAIGALIGKTKELDRGVRVTVEGLDVAVETFRKIEKSWVFGLVKKRSSSFKDASDQLADPVIAAIGEIQGNVMDLASVLGIGADAFEGFMKQIEISTKGMSDEEAAKAVQDALKSVGDDFALMAFGLKRIEDAAKNATQIAGAFGTGLQASGPKGDLSTDDITKMRDAIAAAEEDVAEFEEIADETFGHLIRAGEGAMDTLQALVSSVLTTNDVFRLLKSSMFEMSLEGADMARQLADLFGGLEGFTQGMSTYFQAMYTDLERATLEHDYALGTLEATFEALNLSIPETHKGFIELVEGMDLTTVEGREAYAALVSVADEFAVVNGTAQDAANAIDGVTTALEAAQAEARRLAEAGINEVLDGILDRMQDRLSRIGELLDLRYRRLQVSVAAERDNLEAQFDSVMGVMTSRLEALEDAAQASRAVFEALDDALNARRLTDNASVMSDRRRALMYVQNGGSDPDRLSRSLGILNEDSTGLFGSYNDYLTDFFKTSNIIADRAASAEAQMTADELAVARMEDLIEVTERNHDEALSRLDAILEEARKTYELALDQHVAAINVETAVNNLNETADNYTRVSELIAERTANLETIRGQMDALIAAAVDPATGLPGVASAVAGVTAAVQGLGISITSSIGNMAAAMQAQASATQSQVNALIASRNESAANSPAPMSQTQNVVVVRSQDNEDLKAEIKQMREEMAGYLSPISKNTGSTASSLKRSAREAAA